MAKSRGFKVYAVAAGRVPGIYSTWGECQAQVTGFKNAIFKSFPSHYEAEEFMQRHSSSSRESSSLPVCPSGAVSDARSSTASGDIFRGPGVHNSLKKVYAVAAGHKPGVYASWPECQVQTQGYSRAIYKSFQTIDEAVDFIQQNSAEGNAGANSYDNDRKRTLENISNNDQESTKSNRQALQDNFHMQITIHFDGGSRGNPGVAGAGAEVVVISKKPASKHNPNPPNASAGNNTCYIAKTTYLVRQFCGNRATNNFAEYTGLVSGLQKALSCAEEYCDHNMTNNNSSPASLKDSFLKGQIFGDSNLIIQQLKGVYQCKNDNIVPLYRQCKQLIEQLRAVGGGNNEVSYEHVYREQNKVADALANEAMDQRRSWTTEETSTEKNKNDDNVTTSSKTGAAKTNGQEVIDVDEDDDDSITC